MFRVPRSPISPTFDDTFTVSFWQWLTSTKAERADWAARRNCAARTAQLNQERRWLERGARDAGHEQPPTEPEA